MHGRIGEAQVLGTVLLPLECKDLWLAGGWFPSSAAPLGRDLWFTPAPGDIDLIFLSFYFFGYHEVPGDTFF